MSNPNLENPKREAKESVLYAPPRLPRTRKRALTLPLPIAPLSSRHPIRDLWKPWGRRDHQSAMPQKTDDQEQSLFNKLPPEIRKVIWKEVLGQKLLHVVRRPRKLVAVECRAHHGFETGIASEYGHTLCWGSNWARLGSDRTPSFWDPVTVDGLKRLYSPLSLLLTCRTIYTEAIDMLYTQNIFDVNHVDTIIYLSNTILPRRMNIIRSLQLDWYVKHPMYCDPVHETGHPLWIVLPPHDAGTWEHVWRVIANMEGLRNLAVSVRGRGMLRWGAFELLLQPLMAVKQVPRFEVVLPMWYENPRVANAPFSLRGSGVWK